MDFKKNPYSSLVTLLICLSIFFLIVLPPNILRRKVEAFMRMELTCMNQEPLPKKVDAIYVLGGSQSSLEFKFKTAAKLYNDGITKKILILSRPGKTEYSRLLGRNLTNDEWAILKLAKLGIPRKNIQPICIKKEFWGTFSEAKGISMLAKKKGYKNIILISAPYHTHRVKISFEKFFKDHNIVFYVQGSDEKAYLRQLIIEFLKYKIYQLFYFFKIDL